MLAAQGYLSAEDSDRLCEALAGLADAFARGEWAITFEEEDVHTALESRLVEQLGDLGKRIHLGRSRNDQVLVALRLYYRDVIEGLVELAEACSASCQQLADQYPDQAMPGFTHGQRAMPSSVADWARAFAAEIHASARTLCAADLLVEQNPLGSAAGYGTPGLDLDREMTTAELEFYETQEPVTACQLSRGKAEAALAFSITLLMQDIGRLAADVCLFASQEFRFVSLPNSITTGSSIMPQKRNPDVFELIRARSAMAPSAMQAILAITSKMPSGYHRDYQLLKEPLFGLIDDAMRTLEVAARSIPLIRFEASQLDAAMTSDLFAAQRAFELVKSEGISFRDAYARIAQELK
jgi:argininosuccinate lyase